jgi:hypothetical protein
MRALITKSGAAVADHAADGLEDEEKIATVVSASKEDKDLPNGKPQKVKIITMGANTVQEYHSVCKDMDLREDVTMKSEDAGDVLEVQEDASQTNTKKLVRKRKEMTKSCEREYVPKVKAEENK